MKLIPVYLITVENGHGKLIWGTVILESCSLTKVLTILKQAGAEVDFGESCKSDVRYILEACVQAFTNANGYSSRKIAGTCIGSVRIKKLQGWSFGENVA